MYLFGFGSLINLASAQKSFTRKLNQEDLIPVKIKGYKKVWNSIESIKFDDENINGVFLNLQKDHKATAWGVKVKITPDELEILKLREKNYSCINIEDDLIAFMTTKENKIAKVGDINTFIPSRYIDILNTALENYDDIFKKEYIKETLRELPFSLKEGTYTFSDPIQNKFAKEGIHKNETK